ncbi:MAG: nucleotidyltransferase domain-containing protein [Candidatus Ranarchaeia archaeon]
MDHDFSDILKQILPTEEDIRIFSEVTELLNNKIKKCSKEYSVFSVVPCGSVAKGTDLKDDADIDIFVILDTTSREVLGNYVKVVGRKIAKEMNASYRIGYAENPYAYLIVKHERKGIVVNIVPTVKITKSNPLRKALRISGMVRTPLHAEFALKNFCNIKNEIRLFKFFCKQKKTYGNFGLTGWLCELLVYYYGSFMETLKEIAAWENPVIDIQKKSDTDSLKTIFPNDNVVILDPVDSNRNAAAGIQGRMGKIILNRLINSSKQALEKHATIFSPLKIKYNVEISFFKTKKASIETTLITVLSGFINKLSNNIKRYGYQLEDAFINLLEGGPLVKLLFNEVRIEKEIVTGPPIELEDASKRFLSKNKEYQISEKNGRYFASKPATYPRIESAIKFFFPDLKGFFRLRKIKIL